MMKPLIVCASKFAILVTLLMICAAHVALAQPWGILGHSELYLEDGSSQSRTPFFDNGDSFLFTDDYKLTIIGDSLLYLYPAYYPDYVTWIESITTLNNATGEVLYRDLTLEDPLMTSFGIPYVAPQIDQLGEANNKLKKLTIESGHLETKELYVSELSFLGNGVGTRDIPGINHLTVKDIAVVDQLNAQREVIETPGGLSKGFCAVITIEQGGSLIVSEGDFDGILMGQGSFEKTGDGTLTLRNLNLQHGSTTISGGRLIAAGPPINEPFQPKLPAISIGNGETILEKGAVLQIGDSIYSNFVAVNDFTGNGGTLEIFVNDHGEVSKLYITAQNVTGTTPVSIQGRSSALNLWGSSLVKTAAPRVFADDNAQYLIFSPTVPDAGINEAFNIEHSFDFREGLETSRYKFYFDHHMYDGGSNVFYATAAMQDVIIPDISTMMLTNIIGFEIPRAQNVDGPWAKIKGGQLTDSKSMFNHNTYQTLQVGWDKSLQAKHCENASWNAGMFFEGDWMYGRGDYRSSCNGVAGNIYGNLSSTTNGIGAGLYLSRTNHNNIYFDVAGRMNLFDNKAHMNAMQSPEMNNYRTNWASQTFSLAMELGRNIQSKDGRYSFNPYNQVIYANAPNNDFDVIFADNSIVNVHTNSVDAWTNKLGGLVAVSFKNKEDRVNRMVFGSMNYYQGLSGTFSTQMLDTLNPNAEWVTTKAGRPKNNLSYATGIVGFSLLPKDNFRLTTQSNLLFGDVSGWSVSMTGSIGF